MLNTGISLWLCTLPTDMRKSYDGLGALVRTCFGRTPNCGDGFVFLNRRRTQMKCIYFDRGGYCIWSKRLERGLFVFRACDDGAVALSATEFSALIEGFDVEIRRRRLRAA
jgi:transposase